MSTLRWSSQSWSLFLRDVLSYAEAGATVKLEISYRPSVASRRWYELTWVSQDGKEHMVSAQYMDVLLRRASEVEDRVEAREGWNGGQGEQQRDGGE